MIGLTNKDKPRKIPIKVHFLGGMKAVMDTKLEPEEVAEKMRKGIIDIDDSGNIINWKYVWDVEWNAK